jgi:hypothetical protein
MSNIGIVSSALRGAKAPIAARRISRRVKTPFPRRRPSLPLTERIVARAGSQINTHSLKTVGTASKRNSALINLSGDPVDRGARSSNSARLGTGASGSKTGVVADTRDFIQVDTHPLFGAELAGVRSQRTTVKAWRRFGPKRKIAKSSSREAARSMPSLRITAKLVLSTIEKSWSR